MKQYFLCWYTSSTLLDPSCCFPVSTSEDYISSFCHNMAQVDHGFLVPSILFPEPLFPETQSKITINVQIQHLLGSFYDSCSRSCFPDWLQCRTSNLIPGISAGVTQPAQGKDCKFRVSLERQAQLTAPFVVGFPLDRQYVYVLSLLFPFQSSSIP